MLSDVAVSGVYRSTPDVILCDLVINFRFLRIRMLRGNLALRRIGQFEICRDKELGLWLCIFNQTSGPVAAFAANIPF